MTTTYHADIFSGTCGLGILYDFERNGRWGTPIGQNPGEAGCGWYVAGFIDTPLCKEVYEKCCESFTLIYQSPVRINRNSGNEFFFCVFDAGEREEDDDTAEDF
jgi:hypothetical protein